MKLNFPAFTLCLLVAAFGASAQETTSVPHTFVGGEKAQASQINENFQALVDEIELLKARLTELQPVQLDDRILIDATGQTLGTVFADLYSLQPAIFDCKNDPVTGTVDVDPETGDCIERNPNRFLVSRRENGIDYQLTICNGPIDFGNYEICNADDLYEKTTIAFETSDCSGVAYVDTGAPYVPNIGRLAYNNTESLAKDAAGTVGFYPIIDYFNSGAVSPYFSDSPNYVYRGGPLQAFDTMPVLSKGRTIVFVDANQTAFVTDAPSIITQNSRLTVEGVCEALPTEQEQFCAFPIDDPGCFTCGQLSSDGTQCVTLQPVELPEIRTFSLKPAGFTLPNITLPVTAVAP